MKIPKTSAKRNRAPMSLREKVSHKNHLTLIKGVSLIERFWRRRQNYFNMNCANCGDRFSSFYVQQIHCDKCFTLLLENACIVQPDKLCEICYVRPAVYQLSSCCYFKKSAMRTEPWGALHLRYCRSELCRGIIDFAANKIKNAAAAGAYGALVPNVKAHYEIDDDGVKKLVGLRHRGKSDSAFVKEVYKDRPKATADLYAELIRLRRLNNITCPDWLSLVSPYEDLTDPNRLTSKGQSIPAELTFRKVIAVMRGTNLLHYVDPLGLPKMSRTPIAYQHPPLPKADRIYLAQLFKLKEQTVRSIYNAACLGKSFEEWFSKEISSKNYKSEKRMFVRQ